MIEFILKILRFLFGEPKSKTSSNLPYKRKDYLLTIAEKNFYRVLVQVADKNNVLLFAKIRMEDLLWIPRGTENRFGERNRIKSRHIDFVLCDKENIRPLIAIELDDSSHSREDRIERDDFVDQVFRKAELPILRFPVRSFYDTKKIENCIIDILQKKSDL